MNIQPVNMMFSSKLNFTNNKRSKNADRAVTVQDLYDMEDRLRKQNADLFAKQNKMIGETLDSIARVAYLSPEDGDDDDDDIQVEFKNAVDNAELLTNNGKKMNI